MDRADVVHADGGFVVLTSRWLAGGRIGDRSVTTDVIHDFAAAASEHGFSFYLLGGEEEVNAQCAERLKEMYPKLKIAGRHHGYFTSAEQDSVVADINRAAPDILWVGLGKPREQIFSVETSDRVTATWTVTCGGCFNYITGHYGRAPRWMQDNHLEWLYRAATDPRKFFWRYFTTSPHAIWLALRRRDKSRYPAARLDEDPIG
jgi:exopolysaccharide biosynthesis WecB/TagA/CpsF family protein